MTFPLPLRIALLASLASCTGAGGTASPQAPVALPLPRSGLVWHAETIEGRPLGSQLAGRRINPASVVKVATTLWALERLGPEHRFETRFAIRGTLGADGVLDGDLLVLGSADPDFHVENAYLVARELNRAGLREVSGSILVDARFWTGWEGGSARRERDPQRRAVAMATRLRDALDPQRWTAATRRGVDSFAARRGFDSAPPRVSIHGEPGVHGGPAPTEVLVRHRSNPLVSILKRFNAYSNNDIERLGDSLGRPQELAAWLVARWDVPPGEIRLSTLSGLESNRMTAELVVRLLRDLQDTCRRLGLAVDDVLPTIGCDPGTLEHFPGFQADSFRSSIVAKTGTLTQTDGGVTVLAGFARTRRGELVFCVAVPSSGADPAAARRLEQRWLSELIALHDGPRAGTCGGALPFSDERAEVAGPGSGN